MSSTTGERNIVADVILHRADVSGRDEESPLYCRVYKVNQGLESLKIEGKWV